MNQEDKWVAKIIGLGCALCAGTFVFAAVCIVLMVRVVMWVVGNGGD